MKKNSKSALKAKTANSRVRNAKTTQKKEFSVSLSLPVIAGIVILALVLVAGAWYVTQGKGTATTTTITTTTLGLGGANATELSKVDANYSVTPSDVCKNDQGKPLAFFFGTTDCEFCNWEKPIFEKEMKNFGDAVDWRAYELDTDLQKMSNGEKALFLYYNTPEPEVPVVILGCKYYRIGVNNQTQGVSGESAALKKLTCNLFPTGKKPANCA